MNKNPGTIVRKIREKSNSNHESLLCGLRACIIFLTIADAVILILIMMHAILQKNEDICYHHTHLSIICWRKLTMHYFLQKIGGHKWYVLGALLDETHLAEKHADHHS